MGSVCAVSAVPWTVDAISRRRLLQLGGAAALAAAAPVAIDRLLPAPAALRRSTWLPLVGQRFAVDHVPLRLEEVHGNDDRFSLLFHSARRPRLEQAVRRIAHPAIGAVDLLLVPAGRVRGGHDYAVVVNRVRGG
jgi:Domain of unknown function (DUF6916)